MIKSTIVFQSQFNNSILFKNIIDSFYSIAPIKDINGSSIVKEICIKLSEDKLCFYSDNYENSIACISILKENFVLYNFFHCQEICFNLHLTNVKKFLKTTNKNYPLLIRIFKTNNIYKIELIISINENLERRRAIEFEIEEIQNINFSNDDFIHFLDLNSSDFTSLCKYYGSVSENIKFSKKNQNLIISVCETKTRKKWDSFQLLEHEDDIFKKFFIQPKILKSLDKFSIFDKKIQLFSSKNANSTYFLKIKTKINMQNINDKQPCYVGECNIWVKVEDLNF